MAATNPLNIWLKSFRDLSRLVYPENCIICSSEMPSDEQFVCGFCKNELPYTHYEKFTDASPLDKMFWGRIEVESTYSMLHFQKESSSQQLLHELKYGNNHKLGLFLGALIGERLMDKHKSTDIDLLIPVPIHHRKAFTRGYNQSSLLAKGIGSILNIPVSGDTMLKTRHGSSQTRKGRFLRWDNVQEMFTSGRAIDPGVRHIAFVDDVVTTGATLESLIRSFKEKYPDIRVSIISLAVTK
jgi:ComF family protein